MTVEFPKVDQAAMRCPHCDGDRSFKLYTSNLHWDLPGGIAPGRHVLGIAFCQTCGWPIIKKSGPGEVEEVIYPKTPTRAKAPDIIREADEVLAATYDEAVACEPVSVTAGMFLLGRCAEMILIEKAGASKGKTLGQQIAECMMPDKNSLKEPIAGFMKNAFLHARNQSGHLWYDAEGKVLIVDDDTVAKGIIAVDAMLEEYYVRPITMDAFGEKMSAVHAEKLQGDKV